MRKQNSTNGVPSHERNWSELPQEILHLFSKKLPDISDFIRFRAVCKRWKLSALVTDLPPQLPWLLERPKDSKDNPIRRLYCLTSSKVYTITCPGSRHALLNGPGCRYLLALHLTNSKMHLLNPLTLDQIHIPFVNLWWSLDYVGPDPIEGGYIVVISGVYRDKSYSRSKTMDFWRTKSDDWVYVEGVSNNHNCGTYYKGQYFCYERDTGITNVVDIATKKMAYQVAPPEGTNPFQHGHIYMVESGGKILKLFEHYRSQYFDIHCLGFGDGERKPCWMKITDIGDQMVFLQYNGGLSFSASNFAGFKGNCIYYLKGMQYLCRYDIGDGTTEMLPCPFDSGGTWFVPSMV